MHTEQGYFQIDAQGNFLNFERRFLPSFCQNWSGNNLFENIKFNTKVDKAQIGLNKYLSAETIEKPFTFESYTKHDAKKIRLTITPYNLKLTPKLFNCVISNILVKADIEKKLQSSEERFRLCVDGSQDGIWDWPDTSQDETYWSPQWKNLLGYEDHEIIASAHTFFHEILHPDDRSHIQKGVENLARDGLPFNYTMRLKTKAGHYRWYRGIAAAYRNPQSDAVRMAGSLRDIHNAMQSQLKQQKNYIALQSYVESTNDGHWDWYFKEDYEYMSPRFWEMLGYNAATKRHHPSEWQKLINPKDGALALKNFDLHVKTKGEHPFLQEVRYRHKNGSTVWVICRGSIIEWDDDGTPVRMVGTHTDITEKKRLIRELKSKNTKLAHLSTEIEEFAIIAAHDLKEPLRAFHYYLDELRDQITNATVDGENVFDCMHKLIKSMEKKIYYLMDVAKIDHSHKQPTVDLNSVDKLY